MSLFQWEHQLFCYDWLFYKCFSVPFCRNVLTRSGYWLLITQLNCLYCTTDFLGITLTTRRRERRKKTNVNISSSHWLHQLQSLNTLLVITVNITSYESLIVYYCKYILKFVQRAHRNKKKHWDQRSVVPLPLRPTVPELFYCWVYLKHLWNLK